MRPRKLMLVPPLAAVTPLGGCGQATGRQANSGDIVSVHFTGKTAAEGKVFESTEGGEPRQVHIGANLILPAFEQALIGMREGEKKSFTVKAAQAYGPASRTRR